MAVPAVSVYLRKQRVFVVSSYSPGPGTYIDKDPVFSAKPTDPEAIGRCVSEGLSNHVDGGEMPDWSRYPSPLLAAAGVATWNEFYRGARDCFVKKEADHFLIQSENPHQNLPLGASATEIGLAVLAALKVSRVK